MLVKGAVGGEALVVISKIQTHFNDRYLWIFLKITPGERRYKLLIIGQHWLSAYIGAFR